MVPPPTSPQPSPPKNQKIIYECTIPPLDDLQITAGFYKKVMQSLAVRTIVQSVEQTNKLNKGIYNILKTSVVDSSSSSPNPSSSSSNPYNYQQSNNQSPNKHGHPHVADEEEDEEEEQDELKEEELNEEQEEQGNSNHYTYKDGRGYNHSYDSTEESEDSSDSAEESVDRECKPADIKQGSNDSEWPQGENTYFVKKSDMIAAPNCKSINSPSSGWAMVVYCSFKERASSPGSKMVMRSCLGVYKCSECDFMERPKQPRKVKKFVLPREAKTQCPQHRDAVMVHHSCHCYSKSIPRNTCWEVQHHGTHQHPRPPPSLASIPPHLAAKAKQAILNNPEAKAAKLRLGTNTREGLAKMHPGFLNRNRVQYLFSKVLKPYKVGKGFGSLAQFVRDNPQVMDNFFRQIKLDDKATIFVMMTKGMEERLNFNDSPLQTDTIHGVVSDHDFEGEVDLTFTSKYDIVLGSWSPVCASIHYGRTAEHYRQHFKTLFGAMHYTSYDDFKQCFAGNTSDHSDAIRKAFFDEVRQYLLDTFDEDKEVNDLVHLYRFCDVHFDRSKIRVASNGAVIPVTKVESFLKDVADLRSLPYGCADQFFKLVASFKKKYPKAWNWLNWYLQKDRAPICFPALKKLDGREKRVFESLTETTNAEENIHRTFRNLMYHRQMELGDMIVLLVRYLNDQDMNYRNAMGGVALRYGQNMSPKKKRKRKGAFVNDGRPPDTTSALLKSKNKKKIPQKKPPKEPIIAALQRPGETVTFSGITWGVNLSGHNPLHPIINNTCRLDSFLTVLFSLVESGVLQSDIESGPENALMGSMFALMRQSKHDEARIKYCTDYLNLDTKPGGATINLFGDILELAHSFMSDGGAGSFNYKEPLPCFSTNVLCVQSCNNRHCKLYGSTGVEHTRRIPTVFHLLRDEWESNGGPIGVMNSFLEKEEVVDHVCGNDRPSFEKAFMLAHEIQEGIEEWGGVPANVLKLQKSCPGPALSKKLRTLCWPKLLLFGIADHEQRDGGKMMDDNYKRICISELPLHGMIGTKPNGQRVMELRAAFLGNGTHFTAVIKSGTTWIYYDGLDKEKKMKTYPTNKKSAQHAMHGYSINAVL
jgi:hypothetical protein